MPSREIEKKKEKGDLRVVPAKSAAVPEAVLARIRRVGLRIAVPENKKLAKKKGKKAEVAFSIFSVLSDIFSFLNDRMGAGIPHFDSEDGNVKIATNKVTNVTVANDKNSVSVELGGKRTVVQVDGKAPLEV